MNSIHPHSHTDTPTHTDTHLRKPKRKSVPDSNTIIALFFGIDCQALLHTIFNIDEIITNNEEQTQREIRNKLNEN